jgi:hypothetical protein
MSFLSGFIKFSVVVACAAGSFGGVQGFMAAKAGATPLKAAIVDPIAAKLAEDSDLTGTARSMSPIYPTMKYTRAQRADPAAKKPAKVAVRTANTMPMKIAYIPDRQIATRAGAIFAQVR